MFGSSLPSALGWLLATKVYSGTGADIVMESISLFDFGCECYRDVSPDKTRIRFYSIALPNFCKRQPYIALRSDLTLSWNQFHSLTLVVSAIGMFHQTKRESDFTRLPCRISANANRTSL